MSAAGDRIDRFMAGVAQLREFKTTERIAEFLGGMGYRGKCADRNDCVVARFLRDCIGDADASVSVSPIGITYVWDEGDKSGANHNLLELEVKYESCFADFLQQYDDHAYPELVETAPLVLVPA